MLGRKKKNVGNLKEMDVNGSLISAISEGNLTSVKELVHSYGLSHCEQWDGGYVLLSEAIKSGRIDIAKFLLQKGAKVNSETDNVSTLLHVAVELRCVGLELVQLLLKKNALIDARNDQNATPLHLAAREGYKSTVQVLLHNNASVTAQTNEGVTPLFLALEGRHEEVVTMLLKHACTNLRTSAGKKSLTLLNRVLLRNPSICDKVSKLLVRIVIDDHNRSKIVDDLVGYGFILGQEYVNESLFFAAAEKNYPKLIESILKNYAKSNDAKYSPLLLHTAVKNGCQEIVKRFLDARFDVNATDEEGKTAISYSLNCNIEQKCVKILELLLAGGSHIRDAPELLHTAVTAGFIDICKVLIKNGANVNAFNTNGKTPLHLIFLKKGSLVANCGKQENKGKIQKVVSDEIVKLLLKNGADVSIKATADGMTAFHYAVENGRKETVSIFLDFGVDVDLQAKDNSTPLLISSLQGHNEIVEMLCENGANVDACRKDGWAPIHCAVYREYAKSERYTFSADCRGVVRTLLDNECDINMETNDRDTALDLAIMEARSDYADIQRDLYREHKNELKNEVRYCEYYLDEDKSEYSSGDDDDYIDSNFNPDNYDTVETLKMHLIKLNAAGMHVSNKNLRLLKETINSYSKFKKKCEEEVSRMTEEKLHSRFTVLDIVKNGKDDTHVKNKPLMQILQYFDCKAYPAYESLIKNKCGKSRLKLELLNSGQTALDILIKMSSKLNGKELALPVELLEEIVSYLHDRELKSLIYCSEGLKSIHPNKSERKRKSVNRVDVNKVIISAINEGNLASVRELVHSYGLSHCEDWHGGYVLLRNAIEAGRFKIATFLLQEGARVDCETDQVKTLLHFAVESRPVDSELVHLLLEKNVPLDKQNDQNETPLQIAAKNGDAEIVQVLLNHNASVTTECNEGLPPLFLAVEGRHEEVVRMILKHSCGNKDFMPTVFSVDKRKSLLLNHILLCNPNVYGKVNELVVRIVTKENNHSKIVDDLTDYGFVLGYEHIDEPLLCAATEKSYAKLIENILLNDANPNDAKCSPLLLHTAVKKGHKDIVKVLLNAKFDANTKNKMGKTPLCYSLNCNEEAKCIEIMRLLFASGANINEAPELLHTAVNEGYIETCKVLIENGANINALNTKGMTPLHLAIPKKESVSFYWYSQTQPQRKKIDETTRDKITQLLLSNRPDVSIKATDGFTAFHYAVKHGRKDAVLIFLDFGTDADLRAEDDSTPLHVAALEGHKDIVHILCAKANVGARCKSGSTPLHLASEKGHWEIVELLCRFGADVNACQNKGLTPLHLASKEGSVKIVEFLCKKNADVDAGQKNGLTPLHAAASGNHFDVIAKLLYFGADIDVRGPNYRTALHFAASKDPNCDGVVKTLLNSGSDINAETKNGKTPLDIAISEAKFEYSENRRDMRDECLPDECQGFDFEDNFSDDDDYDFNPDEYQMIETLKKHAVKLKVAGLYISEKNLDLLEDSCAIITDFERECAEEVKRLKSVKSNRQFTFYDVLVNTENLSYGEKMSLARFFKSFNFRKFPIYKNLILSKLELSISRLKLIGPGREALDALVKMSSKLNGGKCSVLPAELLELTLSYLNNSDMKSLIGCAKALKNQQK